MTLLHKQRLAQTTHYRQLSEWHLEDFSAIERIAALLQGTRSI
jgi:hypothetical protein